MVARIKEVIGSTRLAQSRRHDVRTRQAGRMTFVEFHLVVPADIRVAEAHEILRLRSNPLLKVDNEQRSSSAIHVEPEA